jgi:hypothetical protein
MAMTIIEDIPSVSANEKLSERSGEAEAERAEATEEVQVCEAAAQHPLAAVRVLQPLK